MACECCGRRITARNRAASMVSVTRGIEVAWCLKCWDSDPRAVEQYRDGDALWKAHKAPLPRT